MGNYSLLQISISSLESFYSSIRISIERFQFYNLYFFIFIFLFGLPCLIATVLLGIKAVSSKCLAQDA
jgi:hypothetical protein